MHDCDSADANKPNGSAELLMTRRPVDEAGCGRSRIPQSWAEGLLRNSDMYARMNDGYVIQLSLL